MDTITATHGPDRPDRLTKEISISVDGQGNFTYNPSSYRATQGEMITFTSEGNRPFEVSFVGRTPGNKMYLSNEDPTLTIGEVYRDGAENTLYGVYRYVATIWDGQRVWVDAACGDISVGK